MQEHRTVFPLGLPGKAKEKRAYFPFLTRF